MFKYTFPCGEFKTLTNLTDNGITFDPPVYEQRYAAVLRILEDPRWTDDVKKVAEFGCAEMRLFPLLRRIETIEEILEIDINEETLQNHLLCTKPLLSDFLRHRSNPLHVEVLHGSVADSDDQLKNTDAVIALELIEHVYDDVLAKIPQNIFGFMQPKLAIISTPNSDFNVIFVRFKSLLENGFRHWDHKFEWTREQFKCWCMDITIKYPNYEFALLGVGGPPAGEESIGYVSQIALFVRKDLLGKSLVESLNAAVVAACETPYRRLNAVDFPFHKDTRTKEQKIWDELQFQLQCQDEDDYCYDRKAYKLDIARLLRCSERLGATRELIEQLLADHKYIVEQDYVIIEEQLTEEEEENEYKESDSNLKLEQAQDETESWDT